MKPLKDNWILLVLVAAVIVMAVVLIKQCNYTTEFTGDKKENDSLKTVISNLQNAVNKSVEKLEEANTVFILNAKQSEKDRNLILTELSKLKIKHTDTVIDTTKCCEQLTVMSSDFSNYISLADSEIVKSNNIIAFKDSLIANKDSINTARLAFNTQLQSSLTTITDNYDNIYKSFGKQEKKLKWFKVKEKGFIVLLIGSLIYSATK